LSQIKLIDVSAAYAAFRLRQVIGAKKVNVHELK
jgi:hypothetical protein